MGYILDSFTEPLLENAVHFMGRVGEQHNWLKKKSLKTKQGYTNYNASIDC